MFKQIFITLMTMCFLTMVQGQNCSPVDITLTTQAQVDDFQFNHGDCDVVEGNLTIEGSAIVNLDGLSILTQIAGKLTLDGLDNISSTNGLHNITTVGGFEFNAVSATLSGLSSLEVINGDLRICCNNSLTDLTGLGSVSTINGSLDVSAMGNFTSLNGLGPVTIIGGDLRICCMPDFADATMPSLMEIQGDLDVCCMGSVTNLDGLSNLKTIGDSLSVRSMSNFSSLSGLSRITEIPGGLEIRSLGMLISLDGLHNIINVGNDVTVERNDLLNQCCSFFPLINTGTIGGTLVMVENAPEGNCNNDGSDINEACPIPIPSLSHWGIIVLSLIILITALVKSTFALKSSTPI